MCVVCPPVSSAVQSATDLLLWPVVLLEHLLWHFSPSVRQKHDDAITVGTLTLFSRLIFLKLTEQNSGHYMHSNISYITHNTVTSHTTL